MRLLRIDSSARASSVSQQLTGKFVENWKAVHPGGEVIERDLAKTQLPHITDDWAATYGDPSKITPEQRQYLSTSDALIDELVRADTVVIGAPLYNFLISWELKAWIDQVVRLGKTVTYTPTGPKGLLQGKNAVVIVSRGGAYVPGFSDPNFDFQEPYLRRVLSSMGLNDLTFVQVEHQRRGEQAERARATALEQIGRIVSRLQPQVV